jgi:GDPmannose 4,6-dehydratase
LSKKALIFGISGQDGAYLAKFLLKKNYNVIGIVRSFEKHRLVNLYKLNIINKIKIKKLNILDNNQILSFFKKNLYDEIYYLSGQSSVIESFKKFDETIDSNIVGIKNILESSRILKLKSKIFYSSSGEIFGEGSKKNKFSEDSPHHPNSPYALSKSIGHEIVRSYREMFNLKCCSGILFNHESNLRTKKFVLKKITLGLIKIIKKKNKKIILGNLNIYRDWGWAPEYVEVMWKILNSNKKLNDYIISTGVTTSLKKILFIAFKKFNLNWKNYIQQEKFLKREHDIIINCSNNNLIKKEINWKPKIKINLILNKLIAYNKY